MTISPEELGQRVADARQGAGMSQAELAEQIGMERSALSRVESGKRGVDSLELLRVAEALGRDFGYFVHTDTPLDVRFRAEVADNPAAEKCVAGAKNILQSYRFLSALELDSDVAVVRSESWPAFRGDAVAQGVAAAKFIRHELGLGCDALNIFHFLDDVDDLLVLRKPLGGEGVDGCYARGPDAAVIVINSDKPVGRQRFTAAHEFGHHLLDRGATLVVDNDVFDGNKKQSEKRASAFAANFLAPIEGIRQFLGAKSEIKPNKIAHLWRHYGLSFEATLWRLLDAGYLNRVERERWAQLFSAGSLAMQFGYSRQLQAEEALRNKTFLPARLERLAILAYMQNKISFERLVEITQPQDAESFRRELDGAGIIPAELTFEDLKREARAD